MKTKDNNELYNIQSLKDKHMPKLEDYYDIFDPRGCSTSEYSEYQVALKRWKLDNN